jgi:pSer/pThr/pTyr-binding forkhead associated (FHA) protein
VRLTVLKNHVPINDVVVETPDINESYEIYVGRSEDCHVIIDDPLISRHHFVLKNLDSKWICEKLSQLGVVTSNGIPISSLEIKEGDEIKFGVFAVVVSQLPTSVRVVATSRSPDLVNGPEVSFKNFEEERLPTQELEETTVLEQSVPENLDDEKDDFIQSDAEESFSVNNEEILNESSEIAFTDSEVSSYGDDTNALQITKEPESESTRVFKTFVNYELVLFGDHAPYDRFQVDIPEIFIGRDPKKCQIVLDDPEVSTVHAVIRKNLIDISLEDLNSSNGTLLNGERINKSLISSGDEFVIGSTSFTLETRSDLLDAESNRLMPVESGQTIETEEIEEEVISGDNTEVSFENDAPPEKSIIKRILKDPAKRKKAIYFLAIVVIGYVVLDPAPENTNTKQSPATVDSAGKNATDVNKDKNGEKPKVQLSKELEQKRNMAYELGVNFYEQAKYFEALKEFQIVIEIDSEYKKVQSYFKETQNGLKRLEELETQKRAEEERLKNKKIIEDLLVKAREAVKEKQVTVAESYFSQIAEKDPENIEVQQLKMELEAWQKEQERLALEKAAKEAARKAMVDALAPGKTFYLKKEWYKSIFKLEDFLRRKGTDEDLVKEASDMLSDSKNQLANDLGPLIGKARSLKEGQDLKSAYEAYLEILKIEPTNGEALNEVDEIKNQLEMRSKKVYRDGIIAESLSLFNDAKEKFQEVQQISPTDSEYYKKASEKLKNYLE